MNFGKHNPLHSPNIFFYIYPCPFVFLYFDLWQTESAGTLQEVVWVELLLPSGSTASLDLQPQQDEEGEGEEEHWQL